MKLCINDIEEAIPVQHEKLKITENREIIDIPETIMKVEEQVKKIPIVTEKEQHTCRDEVVCVTSYRYCDE